MTMAYRLKKPNGKWAQMREEIDEAVVAWVRRQERSVFLPEVVEAMASFHGYKQHRTRRSVYRLAAKSRGPRLVRCGLGRYEVRGA